MYNVFKKLVAVLWIMLIIFAVNSRVSAQGVIDTPLRIDEVEREILGRLTAISPEAAPLFQMATQAMDAGDYEKARVLFTQVLELAPQFPDALRRLSFVELQLGNTDLALSYAESAYQADGSANSKAAIAVALSATGVGQDGVEALKLAKDAVSESPDSGYANIILLEVAVQSQDMEGMRIASSNLLEIAPESPLPHYFAGLVAAKDGNWELAADHMNRAEALGMPGGDVEKARQEFQIEQNIQRMQQERWMRRVTYTVGVIGITIFLFAVFWEFVIHRRHKTISE